MVNEFEAEATQVGLQLKNFEEATSLAEQAFSSESAQEDSDDPPAEEDVDEPQASTVDAQTDAETTVTQAEVRTSDAEPKDFGVAIKKAKKDREYPQVTHVIDSESRVRRHGRSILPRLEEDSQP